MIHWDFAVNFFVALFALLDPIGNVPAIQRQRQGGDGLDQAENPQGDKSDMAVKRHQCVIEYIT